jgi:hypothetical protein
MATTHAQIAASPDRGFAVLSHPENYADWVVGSDKIRDADPTWPAVGTRFHHRVGVGPLKVNDHTDVIAVDPPTVASGHQPGHRSARSHAQRRVSAPPEADR